jgi:hypothetical protein
MKQILENDLGAKNVKAIPMNEAYALAYSELSNDGFTGLAFSFGAGMVNAVLSYVGIESVKFSIPNGGDWIDQASATARGVTASQMQSIKEDSFKSSDLSAPANVDEQALSIHYNALLTLAIKSFNERFSDAKDKPQLSDAVPVVVAGGTSMAKGFIKMFKSIVDEHSLPFKYSEIRHAEKPLTAVAEGLLIAAMSEEE